jgi:hypothetical protein
MALLAIGAGAQAAAGLSQPWAVILAALVGAVVTGTFAIWQSVRNARLQKSLTAEAATAQQALEKYKSDLQGLRTELEQRKQASYDFRVQRLTPFLEALNNAIVESYSAVAGLRMIAQFRRHIPALVKQHDDDLGAWWKSAQEMSRLRVQVLLSIEPDAIEPLIRRIEQLMQLHNDLVTKRNYYLSNAASYDDVAAAHKEYVRTGFALLLEIRNALGTASGASETTGEAGSETFLKDLPELLERSSIVSFTYGRTPHNAWVARWAVSTGTLEYEGLEQAEFDRILRDVTRALHDRDEVLDVKLARMGDETDDQFSYVLCLSFADKPALEEFTTAVLPALKLQSKPLWKGLVAPVETLVE